MRLIAAILAATVALSALALDVRLSTPPIGPAPENVYYPAAVPLGEGYVVVWSEDYIVRVVRLDRERRIVDSFSFDDSEALFPARLASDGNEAWIWAGSHLAHIDRDGVVEISEVPHFGSIGSDRFAAIAGSGSATLVYQSDTCICAARVDRHGQVLLRDAPLAAVPRGRLVDATAVAVGDGFLLAWSVGYDPLLFTAHVRSSDVLLKLPATLVGSQTTQKFPAHPMFAMKDGAATLLWLELDDLHRVGFDVAGGAPSGTEARIARGVSSAAVAVAADGVRLAEATQTQLVVSNLTPDGALTALARKDENDRAVALAGDLLITTTEMFDGPEGYQVLARPLGYPGDTGSILSLGVPSQALRKIFWTANGYVAVWSEFAPNERVVVGRVTADGRLLDGAGLRLRESRAEQTSIDAATNGKDLYVVWSEKSGSTSTVRRARPPRSCRVSLGRRCPAAGRNGELCRRLFRRISIRGDTEAAGNARGGTAARRRCRFPAGCRASLVRDWFAAESFPLLERLGVAARAAGGCVRRRYDLRAETLARARADRHLVSHRVREGDRRPPEFRRAGQRRYVARGLASL